MTFGLVPHTALESSVDVEKNFLRSLCQEGIQAHGFPIEQALSVVLDPAQRRQTG